MGNPEPHHRWFKIEQEDFNDTPVKTCAVCGAEIGVKVFKGYDGKYREITPKKYCSDECAEIARMKRRTGPKRIISCAVCGDPFVTPRTDRKVCEKIECKASYSRRKQREWVARKREKMSHGNQIFKSGENPTLEADFVQCPKCGLRKLKYPFSNMASGQGQLYRCSNCKSLFTVRKKTVLVCELYKGPEGVNLF